MSTFLTTVIICGLIFGTSVLTYRLAKQEILKDFKNSLLEAKKEGKVVSITIDGIKLSINPKDLRIEVLTE